MEAVTLILVVVVYFILFLLDDERIVLVNDVSLQIKNRHPIYTFNLIVFFLFILYLSISLFINGWESHDGESLKQITLIIISIVIVYRNYSARRMYVNYLFDNSKKSLLRKGKPFIDYGDIEKIIIERYHDFTKHGKKHFATRILIGYRRQKPLVLIKSLREDDFRHQDILDYFKLAKIPVEDSIDPTNFLLTFVLGKRKKHNSNLMV